MNAIMQARSFRDPKIPNVTSTKDLLGSQVIASLAGVLFEWVFNYFELYIQVTTCI